MSDLFSVFLKIDANQGHYQLLETIYGELLNKGVGVQVFEVRRDSKKINPIAFIMGLEQPEFTQCDYNEFLSAFSVSPSEEGMYVFSDEQYLGLLQKFNNEELITNFYETISNVEQIQIILFAIELLNRPAYFVALWPGKELPKDQWEDNFIHLLKHQLTSSIENSYLFDLLLRAKNEWEKSVDVITEGVVLVDATSGDIVRLNKPFAKQWNLTPQEIIGEKLCKFICKRQSPYPGCLCERGVEGESFLAKELETSKGIRWFELATYPIADEETHSTRVVMVARDVTKQREKEQAFQKMHQKLKLTHEELRSSVSQLKMAQKELIRSEKMASVGQLAAGLAHEINNPMSYIKSNLVYMKKYMNDLVDLVKLYQKKDISKDSNMKIDGQTIEEIFLDMPELVREMESGVSRVTQIIKDVKTFTRGGSDEVELANIHTIIDATLGILKTKTEKIEIQRRYGNIPDIECYPSQIGQVISNLVTNAVQAIERNDGLIIITTSVRGEDNICIEVSDNGRGIPEDKIGKIFDPFFTTKPIGEGTGLGLSISYAIIENHCGKFQVISTVGDGATFSITLPIHQKKEPLTQM